MDEPGNLSVTTDHRVSALVSTIVLGVLLILGLTPLGLLLVQALSSGGASAGAFASGRALTLLGRSLTIAAGSTTVAMVLGSVVGLLLARIAVVGRALILLALFVVFSISPYVLALGWLGGRLDSTAAGWMLGRPEAVVWVLGTALSPLAALLVYGAARRQPLSAEEAGFLFAPPWTAVRRISMRGLLPAFVVVATLVFSISLSDYAVASLLQVPTYPVEVFLYYAGSFDPLAAARACLPLVLCGIVLSAVLAPLLPRLWLRRQAPTPARTWPLTRTARRVTTAVLFAVLALVLVLPWLRILTGMPGLQAGRRAVAGGFDAIANSILLSVLAALLTLCLAWPASGRLVRGPTWRRAGLAVLLLVPLFVPASAFGISWVETANRWGLTAGRLGLLAPALCLAARLGGATALFLAGVRLSLPLETMEAALVFEGNPVRRWFWIELPMLLPYLAAVFGVLVALDLNAVDLLVLTVPAGYEILPLRIDNLMHYGLPEEASVLALVAGFLAAGPILVGAGIHRMLKAC